MICQKNNFSLNVKLTLSCASKEKIFGENWTYPPENSLQKYIFL